MAKPRLPKRAILDESTHRYTDPETGAPLPALTKILRAAGFGDEYGMVRRGVREDAMARGTRVHAAARYDDEGDLEESSVPEADRGFLEAWRSARSAYSIRIWQSEEPCIHPQKIYCCTPDVLGSAILGGVRQPVIIERKTGACPPWVRYQLAGQQMCTPTPYEWTRFAVELHDDGTFAIRGPWFAKDYHADAAVVMAALTIWSAKEEL